MSLNRFSSRPSVSVPGINNAESKYYIVISASELPQQLQFLYYPEHPLQPEQLSERDQLRSAVTLSNGNQILTMTSSDDLTGTLITADKKIAVTTGSQMVKSHENCTTSAHTAEQMTPTETLGNETCSGHWAMECPILSELSVSRFFLTFVVVC